jgi:FHS family L-fucose permease-like MFS transporter
MAIPTAFYVCAWIYPIYANVWNKKVLDGHRATDLNVTAATAIVSGEEKGGQERIEMADKA